MSKTDLLNHILIDTKLWLLEKNKNNNKNCSYYYVQRNNNNNEDDKNGNSGVKNDKNDFMISDDEVQSDADIEKCSSKKEKKATSNTSNESDTVLSKPLSKTMTNYSAMNDDLDCMSSDEPTQVSEDFIYKLPYISTSPTPSTTSTSTTSCNNSIRATTVNVICSCSKTLVAVILYYIVTLANYFIDFVLRFTKQTCFIKGMVILPRELLERLYCFATVNKCRVTPVCGYMTLPDKKTCKEENVFTPCTWPMFALAVTICCIFAAGCHTTKSDSSIVTKYHEGLYYLNKIRIDIQHDIYFIPGQICMERDRCCYFYKEIIFRWLKCMAYYPFTIAQNAWGREDVLAETIRVENALNNLTDWRMKRNLKRIRISLEKDLREIRVMAMKTRRLDSHGGGLNDMYYKNFTRLKSVIKNFEIMEFELFELMRDFEELMAHMKVLTAVRDRLAAANAEVHKCLQCSWRSTMKELEKSHAESHESASRSLPRIEGANNEFHEHQKYRDKDERILELRKLLKETVHEMHEDHLLLGHIQMVPQYMKNDFKFESQLIIDYVDRQESGITSHDQKTADRFSTRLKTANGRLKTYSQERKYAIKSMTKKYVTAKGKEVHKNLMQKFCHAMKETVKMTIYSTINFGFHKKCSMVNTEILENSEEHHLNLDEIIDEISPISCTNNNTILRKIAYFLTIWESRNIMPWQEQLLQRKYNNGIYNNTALLDYASYNMGARIVDVASSNEPNWEMFNMDNNVNSVNSILQSDMKLGNCWKIKKLNSYVIVRLSRKINVTHVAIEHISRSISLDGINKNAPKHFEIYSIKSRIDKNEVLIGSYIYDNSGEELQIFSVSKPTVTHTIKLLVKSNYGDENTCLYRFRVFSRAERN